jgi:hypothetical protein
MKIPARKKTSRHFCAELTEGPVNAAGMMLAGSSTDSNIALPGLTRRRTFDVISFATGSLFCIGKGERFLSARN